MNRVSEKRQERGSFFQTEGSAPETKSPGTKLVDKIRKVA